MMLAGGFDGCYERDLPGRGLYGTQPGGRFHENSKSWPPKKCNFHKMDPICRISVHLSN